MAGAEGGEGWVAAPRAGIPHGPETSSSALPVQALHRTQGGWWLLCWALSSSSSRKGTHSTRVSRATSPAATLLLTVRGNSTLQHLLVKYLAPLPPPPVFAKKTSVSVSPAPREITQAPEGLQSSIQGRQSFSAQAIFFSLKMFSILLKCMKQIVGELILYSTTESWWSILH